MRKSIFVFIVIVLAVVGTVNKFDTVSCIFIVFVLLCTIVWYLTDKKKPQKEENAEETTNGSEFANNNDSVEENIVERPQTEEISEETNKSDNPENEEK